MLTFDQLNVLPETITEVYESYLQSVINDIARRIAKMGEVTPLSAWQMQRLTESGGVYEDALRQIAKITGKSESELREAMKWAGVKSMEFDDRIYRAAGLSPIPLKLSPAMQQVLLAGLAKTNATLKNLTLTTALSAQASFVQESDLAYMQVSSGAMSYDQAIRAAIKRVADSGLTTIDYKSGHRDQLDVAVRRAVLTGVSQTVGVIQMQRAEDMGVDLVQTSAHAGARNKGVGPQNHESWQGKIFSRSGRSKKYPPFVETTGYGTGDGLMGWNCVLGNTLISSPTIRTAYRREYSGEIIVIHVSGGEKLSVTPNHPILTDLGWVAAGLLDKGSYIVKGPYRNRVSSVSPNVDKNISSIADIFNALSVSGEIATFPVSASDFHGDIGNGEVDVVFSDRFLRNAREVGLSEHVEKRALGNTSYHSASLSSVRPFGKLGDGPLDSSNGIVCGFGEPAATVRSRPEKPLRHCIGAIISDWYAEPIKIPSDGPFGYSNLGGDLIFPHPGVVHIEDDLWLNPGLAPDVSFPSVACVNTLSDEAILDSMNRTSVLVRDELKGMVGEVQLDYVVNIERKSFVGHVYNLHTEGEWYSANGIITHNCRHSFFPYFEGVSENAYSEVERKSLAKKTVDYNGQKISMYDATQVQRYIERNIRRWKRQAQALAAAGLENSKEMTLAKSWQARMRDFIKQTGLSRQSIREQVQY